MEQVNQCLNHPDNLKEYQLKENEAITNRSRYDTLTGQLLRLYEKLVYLMVRDDSDKCFLDYGYLKQNSKILHSYHRKRMLNSFSGTFFNRHRIQYESGALNTGFSKIYLFLPSITDRIEDVNRHMGSVNLSSIDITEDNFEVKSGIPFDTSKLDYENPDNEKMRQAVLRVLKKVVDLSKNADRLLSKRSVE